MVTGDVEVTRKQLCRCHSFIFPASVSFISKVRGELCCCHSFIFNVNVPFISKVRVTGGPGGIVHVVVGQLFSTSMCHSFEKRGSPVVFLLSACRPRLVGWLRFLRFSVSLIIIIFNFFAGFFHGLHTCFNF